MNILKALTRTYFLGIAINTLFDKVRWNMAKCVVDGKYPRTKHGVLQAAHDGMFPTVDGGTFDAAQVEQHLDEYGVENTLRTLGWICALSDVKVSDFMMSV